MIAGKKTVLVTRPEKLCLQTIQHLQAADYHAYSLPLTRTISLCVEEKPAKGDAVIVTSSAVFFHGSPSWLAQLQNLPLYCVGMRTAQSAQEAGFHNIVAVAPTADALRSILAMQEKQHFIYLTGKVHRDVLIDALEQQGHISSVYELYDTLKVHPSIEDLHALPDSLDACLLYSGMAAEMVSVLDGHIDATTRFICLSHRIKEHLLMPYQKQAFVAPTPDETGVFMCLESCFTHD